MNFIFHAKNPIKCSMLGLCMVCLSGASFAQDAKAPIDLNLGLTTFGASVEGRYNFNETIAIRGFYAGGLSYKGTRESDGVDYNLSGKLGGAGVMFDYRPLQSGWFVSGGALMSKTRISGDVTASDTNQINVGDTTLNNGETLSIGVEFKNKIAPMVTTGYTARFGDGFSLTAEIGAVIVGDISIDASTSVDVDQADIDAKITELSNDITTVKTIPFIGINFGYSF